jgi:ABC-type multidrug transport system permease subunit
MMSGMCLTLVFSITGTFSLLSAGSSHTSPVGKFLAKFMLTLSVIGMATGLIISMLGSM